MLKRLALASALILAPAASAAPVPSAMKVLPDYAQLVFVGQGTGAGGQTVGYFVDPTSIEKSDGETSIETVQFASNPVAAAGKQVRFVEMRMVFDCAKNTFKFGDLVARDSSGKVVESQEGVSPPAPLSGQNPIQAAIRKVACK